MTAMDMENNTHDWKEEDSFQEHHADLKWSGANIHCADQTGSVMRENFEQWYEASIKPLEISYLLRRDEDGYVYAPAADAWEAWQAAIRSQNTKLTCAEGNGDQL